MSEIIYVIQGTTGEYSDRSDWIVCAYRSKEKAEEHASKAMRRGKEIEKSHPRYYSIEKGENEFDPDMRLDYTGTEYTTFSVEIRD